MSKLSTKFVILILAAGIVIAAATTATIISVGIKPSNFALAQVRFPFQPQVKDPLQQPLATAGRALNCVGCVITKNLANGAVTNPKLASGSVLSANIGAGQVMTPNIAGQAVTTPKIASGAVSISTAEVRGVVAVIAVGHEAIASAICPSGTIVVGGGYTWGPAPGLMVLADIRSGEGTASQPNGWLVEGVNNSVDPGSLDVEAECATIHP